MPKLNQVIAIEKGVKSRAYAELTETFKVIQKPDLFQGFAKTYRPKDEAGETYPPEHKKVQFNVETLLKKIAGGIGEAMDVTVQKDSANTNAYADVVIEDADLTLSALPVTFLLSLEKQFTDLRTFIVKLPVLDEIEDWSIDQNTDLYKTNAISTHRTKKTQTPIVLYNATKEHPAQTQIITEDVLVGYWETIKHSGAMPAPRKEIILGRMDAFIKAVKFAREKANEGDAPKKYVGDQVFNYLFA